MIDPKKDLTKCKAAELDAELDLYRAIEGMEVPPEGDEAISNVEKRAAVITKLREDHGHPIRIDAEFKEANPTLAKLLEEQGAVEGDVVLAEVADLEKAAELDAEAEKRDDLVADLGEKGITFTEEELAGLSTADLEAKLEEASKAPEAKAGDACDVDGKAGVLVQQGEDLVCVVNAEEVPEAKDAPQTVDETKPMYFQGKPVVSVKNRIIGSKVYKDVDLGDATYTLSTEEFAEQVTGTVPTKGEKA